MPSLRIHDLPEKERPRERLVSSGASSLSDAELLAIFLGSGIPGRNAIELAQDLILKHQSLRGIAALSAKKLMAEPGIGPAKAAHLAAAFEIGHRLAREKIHRSKIDDPETVYQLLGAEMSALNRESLRVLLLNTRYELIHTEQISLGSLNESIAHPRHILEPAILHSAYAFILVHNHPSGDPSPSEADRQLTRRIADVSSQLQVQLVDHIIIGQPSGDREPFFSFKEMGLL